jgi:hypothetical protein
MSEPDAIDFNTLGNNRYGVIRGCAVTVSGTTASVAPGIVLVDGLVVYTAGGSVTLNVGDPARFYLICVKNTGQAEGVAGLSSANPVFPDISSEHVALASVYCPSSESNLANYVIDKRNMLAPVFVSSETDTSKIIFKNTNSTNGSDSFRIYADGKLGWSDDNATLYRSGDMALTTNSSLAAKALSSTTTITATGNIAATGTVTGSNLKVLSALPGTVTNGVIVRVGEKVYLGRNNSWEEIVTPNDITPVGTVIQSMLAPSEMALISGSWIPLVGQTLAYSAGYAQLFSIAALQSAITFVDDNPVSMVLPDARNRMLLGVGANAATLGGVPNGTITLTTDNIPAHAHNVTSTTDGKHTHSVAAATQGSHNHGGSTVAGTGKHAHDVTENPHFHNATNYSSNNNPPQFIVGEYTPQYNEEGARWWDSRLDPWKTDTGHSHYTWTAQSTASNKTNLKVNDSNLSNHSHTISTDGAHSHTISFTDDNIVNSAHKHSITEVSVGKGQSFSVMPPYLTVYTYIRG